MENPLSLEYVTASGSCRPFVESTGCDELSCHTSNSTWIEPYSICWLGFSLGAKHQDKLLFERASEGVCSSIAVCAEI